MLNMNLIDRICFSQRVSNCNFVTTSLYLFRTLFLNKLERKSMQIRKMTQ